MSDQPNPQKAIYLSPNQKRLPGNDRQASQPAGPQAQWVPHQSDMALDAWGEAVRLLRESGKLEGRG
jgi:hypothetical protein